MPPAVPRAVVSGESHLDSTSPDQRRHSNTDGQCRLTNEMAGHLTRLRVYNTYDIFDPNVVGGLLFPRT